jgi:hypothetical protein
MIQPLRQNVYYPGPPLDWEEALETALYDMMGSAVALGWTLAEIRLVIRRLVPADKRHDEEEAKLEAHLAILRAIKRARS